MNIWICIPVFNRVNFTLKCLASLKAQSYQNFSVILCDHGSTDGTSTLVKQQFPDVIIINASSQLWWTGAINVCIRYVLAHAQPADTLLTMNNDNEVPTDYLQNLNDYYDKYPGAILTSVIHNIETTELESPGYRYNWWLAAGSTVDFSTDHLPTDTTVVEVTHASGRGTLFPIKVFQQIGLFDERHLPHYLADYDLSFKAARAHYKIYACLNAKVFSYIEETGLVKVLNKFSVKSFIDYFFNIRSPGNLPARWWFAWNNCPKYYLGFYLIIDFTRVFGGYFKNIIKVI